MAKAGAPRRILVRCPNWVGDVVMATPALRALRRLHPDARIDLLLKPYVRPVMDGSTRVDGIVEIGPEEDHGALGAFRLGRRLRRGGYDLLVLFANSLTTGLEAFFSGIKRRIGYAGNGRRLLLTDVAEQPGGGRLKEPTPMTRVYLGLLRILGSTETDETYEIVVTEREREEAEQAFSRLGIHGGERVVALNPGARFGSSKLWDPGRFAAVGDRLIREAGVRVLVLSGPGEEPIARAVAGAMRERADLAVQPPIGLGTLKAVMANVALLITTDSGPRHIAQALKTPTLVLMGSTHPGWTATNLEKTAVLRFDVPCGPCHKKTCPTDHRCMDLITPESVFHQSLRMLLPGWRAGSASEPLGEERIRT
jgi:heptosyltransferase-2